jgi:hypothetical protein
VVRRHFGSNDFEWFNSRNDSEVLVANIKTWCDFALVADARGFTFWSVEWNRILMLGFEGRTTRCRHEGCWDDCHQVINAAMRKEVSGWIDV